MKNAIRNCLITTGLALILLAIVATIYNGQVIFIESIYQIFIANTVINIGLAFIKQFESKYFLIEIFMEIGSVIVILIISGFVFDWYSSIHVWILIIMGIVVYLIGIWIDVFRIKNDIRFINNQLIDRKEEIK